MPQAPQAVDSTESIGHDLPHVAADQPEVLHEIAAPGVNLSLWTRPPQPSIARELSSTPELRLADVRRTTTPASFDSDVRLLMEQQRVDPDEFTSLRADMAQLAELFFRISGGREVQYRLVTTRSDDCRRFHLDRKYLRLLCTYKGPGTEWLTDAQVDRVALARCAPNSEVVRFGEPSRLETFWVGIMKGDPNNESTGLVHRSPPIEDSGQTRVLFCLDC